MNDLLQVAVNAHGRLERWNQLKTVKAGADEPSRAVGHSEVGQKRAYGKLRSPQLDSLR